MYYGGVAGVAILLLMFLLWERSVPVDGVTVRDRVTGAAQ
jgi:hypothetical protein